MVMLSPESRISACVYRYESYDSSCLAIVYTDMLDVSDTIGPTLRLNLAYTDDKSHDSSSKQTCKTTRAVGDGQPQMHHTEGQF